MATALRDIFRHNAWANRKLLEFLGTLTPQQLEATSGAVYGGVLVTLHHTLAGEAAYWAFFSGRMPAWYIPESEPSTVQQMQHWERDIAVCWEQLPLDDVDADTVLERTRRDGSVTRMKAGLVLAQCIHHGNVHREQISHILTDLRIEVPDLSLYAYAREAGA